MWLSGLIKKSVLLILVLAIVVPLRYGSTNHHYLFLRCLHSMLWVKHTLLPDPARPTLSADYRAFENMLRMKPLVDHDPLADPMTILEKVRPSCSMTNVVPKPVTCQVHKEIFEHDGHNVDAYWVNYTTKNFQRHSDKLILFLHGGGYVLGDVHSYAGFECHLAQLSNTSVLHVEYRLSPEHPFPAAVDDTIAVYRTLRRNNVSPSQMIFMGDSAGGGLALLTVQALLAHHLRVPRGVITISPWADLTTSSESYTRNEQIDPMLHIDRARWVALQLLGPNRSQLSLYEPMFSPLFGHFEGFPPMYVTVGTAEIIEDDARAVVKKAREADADVTFEEGLHLMHIYPLFFPYFPEARHTLDNMNKWMQTIFNKKHHH